MTTGKIIALTIWAFVGKLMSLLFNMLSRFVIAFIQGASVFNDMAEVTISSDFGAQENKICHCFHFILFYFSWSDGTICHDIIFWNWVLIQLFHSPLSLSSRGSLVPLHFLPVEWYHLHITLPASWEIYMQVNKQQLEPNMEQQTGSKLRKEYVKIV